MDKSARLLSDLRDYRSGTSTSSHSYVYSVFDDHILASDLDMGEAPSLISDDDSEFSEDSTDSENDLEGHLQLLWPQELHSMGLDALKSKQYEAAVKYLNMANLEWTETLARSLVVGSPVQLDETAILESWLIGKYIQIANLRGVFRPRQELAEEFFATSLAKTMDPAASSTPTPEHENQFLLTQ